MPKLKLGTGAKCYILLSKLKPSVSVKQKFPNYVNIQKLRDLEILRLDFRIIAKARKLVVMMSHDLFGDEELYAVPFYIHVTEEGPEDGVFAVDDKGRPLFTDPELSVVQNDSDEPVIPAGLLKDVVQPDDPEILNAINTLNIGIDDDNLPPSENVPNTNEMSDDIYSGDWKHDGICFRRSNGHVNRKPKLVNVLEEMKVSKLQMFEILFPVKFVKTVMIPEMNKVLVHAVWGRN